MAEIPADIPRIGDLKGIFEGLVGSMLGLAAIVLFVMLVIGGIKYTTAGSDPKAAEGAKKTLTYAIGGMVLIALSYLIILVIQEFTGANVTDFNIVGN